MKSQKYKNYLKILNNNIFSTKIFSINSVYIESIKLRRFRNGHRIFFSKKKAIPSNRLNKVLSDFVSISI